MDKPRKMSPWVPMTNARDKKVIGKLLEELGEATSAAARSLIQGIDGVDPTSGKINRQWLTEELADVHALTMLTQDHFELDLDYILDRAKRKLAEKMAWLDIEAPNG